MTRANQLLVAVCVLASCSSGGSSKVDPTAQFSISGMVSGAVSAGVTIALQGPSTATAVTDASGGYRFAGLVDGAYAVAPLLAGYTFSPASRSVTLNGADVAGQDFSATAIVTTHTISGTVSGAATAGVTITLAGSTTGSTITSGDGSYAFAALPSGTYTLTATRTGYTFEPPSRNVSISGTDVTGQDFTATAVPHAISGTVSGAARAGVTIALKGPSTATAVTDASGGYRFAGLVDGAYAVAPLLPGFTFSPASRTVTLSGADLVNQDFTATAIASTYSISGTVTGAATAGVTIYLGGAASRSTLSSSDGSYAFSALPNGSYIVTPSRNDYTFLPPSRAVTINGADVVLDEFVSQPLTATWAFVPSGTTSILLGVWGSSPDDVWIVGNGPILHWDGSSLTSMQNPAGQTLHAVWGASASDVWAIGEYSIVHWDGSSWAIPSSASAVDTKLHALWGSSASDIWAVGAEPWHYDGTVWSRGAAPFPTLKADDEEYGIWGSDPNDVWAVGDNINRFDGRSWGMYLGDADMQAVWGASSSEVWAVGRLIAHYDGHRWSGVSDPITQSGGTLALRAIWGSSAADIWAVGGGTILRWDGSRWSGVQPMAGTFDPLWGVWGASASDVWMVGENGTVLRYH